MPNTAGYIWITYMTSFNLIGHINAIMRAQYERFSHKQNRIHRHQEIQRLLYRVSMASGSRVSWAGREGSSKVTHYKALKTCQDHLGLNAMISIPQLKRFLRHLGATTFFACVKLGGAPLLLPPLAS